MPCLRCWKFGLICKPQDPVPASPGLASPEQQPPASPAEQPPSLPPSSPAAAADSPAADADADAGDNPFLAALLRQWDPAVIASAFVAVVATLLPDRGDSGVGGGSAAGAANLLDRGLVEAAM